jgi:hypothetical protein
VSAAELLRWPITKWTRPCANFVESTMGSQRFCATCSFERHTHRRSNNKEENVGDEMLEKCRAVAAALKALPCVSSDREFRFGVSAEAMIAVAALPGASTRTTLYRHDERTYAIDQVSAVVDGVTFHAQAYSRDLTFDESQRLAREGREHGSMVTA